MRYAWLAAVLLAAAPLRAQEAPTTPMFNPIMDAPSKVIPQEARRWCKKRYWSCDQPAHAVGMGVLVVGLDRLTPLSETQAKWAVFGLSVVNETVDVILSLDKCGKTGCHKWEPAPALDPFIDLGFRALGAFVVGPALNKLIGGRK